MHECRDKMMVEGSSYGNDNVATLPTMDTKKFKESKLSFINYLQQRTGSSGVALRYVVRDAAADPDDATTDDERMILQAPLVGAHYNRDNKLVYDKLEQWVLNTDAFTWFDAAPKGNGREAFITIVDHYEGAGETSKRTAAAEATLETLHYKKEGSFSFEKYVTKMSECFKELEDSDEGYTERKKVQIMLNGMKSDQDPIIASLKISIRSNLLDDFIGASTMLLSQIALAYPGEINNFASRKRRVAQAETDRSGRGRGRRGRGGGRGGRGGRYGGGRGRSGGGRGGGGNSGPIVINGIDVSDVHRSFAPDEWNALGPAKRWVAEQRNRGRGGGGRGGDDSFGGRGRGRGDDPRQVGAAEQVETSGTPNEEQGGRGSGNRGNQNGTGFGHGRYGGREGGRGGRG
jgi:hypothetical protein